jgi:hypothetical protein
MLSRLAALFALCIVTSAAIAASKSIAHDFLLSLQPEASEETYNQVIETLEKQGATSALQQLFPMSGCPDGSPAVKSKIYYPNIMLAISFEDTKAKAAGSSLYKTAGAQLEAWKTSLATFGESIYSLEQDQIVSIPHGEMTGELKE